MKQCVLTEEKICNHCQECMACDLDSNKICDNCGKCIEDASDYKEILIDEILHVKDYRKED